MEQSKVDEYVVFAISVDSAQLNNEVVCHGVNTGGVTDLIDTVSIGDNTESVGKCQGYLPTLVGSVFRNFPFILLEDHRNIIFEGESFHHISCLNNQYSLIERSSNINPGCAGLVDNVKLNKIIDSVNDA